MNNKLFMNLISLVYLMILVGVVVCDMLSTNLMLLIIIIAMMIWSIVIAMVDSEYINYEKH